MSRGITRRGLLAGGTVAGLAAIWGVDRSIAQQVVDATGGSVTAAREAMQVAEGLFIGPRTAQDAVPSAPDRLFVGTDARPPLVHQPDSGTLDHQVVASGDSLPAFVAPTTSELAVPPSTPALTVVDDAGLRVATGDSFVTNQQLGDTQMTRARSIHVAEQPSDLPTPSETPAIAVTRQTGMEVWS